MGLRDGFDAVTDVVAPELKISVLAAKVLLAAFIAVALCLAFWWIFLRDGQASKAHEIAASHAEAELGAAQGEAGAHATNAVAGQSGRETIIHERTNTNYVEIAKQPGAGDPISDAVDAAFRHAVCLRASAARLPDCQRLQEAHP